jgi:hypothetical protein
MIPAGVVIVQTLGWLQSLFFIVVKPWSPSKKGAWDAARERVTDCCCGSPRFLFKYRLAAFLYALAIGIDQIRHRGLEVFRFYTVWNWWLLTAYFALVAGTSYFAVSRSRSAGKLSAPAGGTTVGRLQHTIIVLFHVNLTMVWIVDVLTWTVLWPMLRANPDPVKVNFWRLQMFNYTSYHMHGLNALFMLIEFALNDIPVYTYMLGWVGLWSSLFGVWAHAYHAHTGLFLYPFLNTTKPWAPAAYFGLLLVQWLFFFTVLALARLKKLCLPYYASTTLVAASKKA